MKQGAPGFRLSSSALAPWPVMPVPWRAPRSAAVDSRRCMVRRCTPHIERRGTEAIATPTAGAVAIATAMVIAMPMVITTPRLARLRLAQRFSGRRRILRRLLGADYYRHRHSCWWYHHCDCVRHAGGAGYVFFVRVWLQ